MTLAVLLISIVLFIKSFIELFSLNMWGFVICAALGCLTYWWGTELDKKDKEREKEWRDVERIVYEAKMRRKKNQQNK